jgi:uncharacterized damage-inducible protein DinB
MKDVVFIKEMLQRGKEAKDKVIVEFSDITLQQLNWKPAPGSWSIGQCLDHLVISDSSYFPALKKIAEGKYKMTIWERWSPFSAICGRILVDKLQEQVKKKMKAPKVFLPSVSNSDIGILQRFHQCHDIFMNYIAVCDKTDLDRTIITSPSIKFVTYSLRNAIRLLIQHQHRHINQAIRVKWSESFPE